MTNPFNDNELNFNQNKAQKYKALSIALSAECTLLPSVLTRPNKHDSETLWNMIKELHSQLTSLEYSTFSPQLTLTQVLPTSVEE